MAKNSTLAPLHPEVAQDVHSARSRSRGMTPRRNLWAKLSLSVAAAVLTLAGMEVATRLFSHVTPPLLCNHPLLGTTYLPGYEGSVYVPECDREVWLRFNHAGMRGPDIPLEKKPGVRRIAVIGDSMIAAIATDEEKTLVHRLGQRLNEGSGGTPYEVLNFGISGSSTGQELVLYRELVRKYRPDLVVCAFCVINDLGDNCTRLTSNRGRIYFDVDDNGDLAAIPLSPGRARLTSWLNRYSRLYVWQKGATQAAINTIRDGALHLAAQAGHDMAPLDSRGQGIYCTDPSETLKYAWRITEKLIETLDREVRADDADFLLAVLPSGAQVCDDAWAKVVASADGAPMDWRYPDEALGQIAARVGTPVVLMADRFRAAAPHHALEYEDELLHYGGTGHFNDRGNELAAEAICEAIAAGEKRANVASRPAHSP